MTDRPISISQFATPRWGLGELLVNLRSIQGIDGLGLWPERFDGMQTSAVHRVLRDADLRVSSLSFTPDFANDEHGSVTRAHYAIDQARELRSPTLIVHALPAQGPLSEEAKRHIRRGLQAVGDHAEQASVTLALDAPHPDAPASPRSPGMDLEQALELVQGINHAAIVLNTRNVGWDPHLSAKIHRAIGWVGLVQLGGCEGNLRTGDVSPTSSGAPLPLGRIVAQAQVEGYVGWYEIDASDDRLSPEHYPSLIRHCVHVAQRLLGLPERMAVAPTS